jgi:iodotyrosine deiodinase
MTEARFVPLAGYRSFSEQEMLERSRDFAIELSRRRTVREFSDRPIPREVIENCLRAAGTAPSGAHQQPWRFVAVADTQIKHRIRVAAEEEEREFYTHRAPPDWLAALAPLGTHADKPFLDVAPWLIAVFYERFGLDAEGLKSKRYYPHESVGIACGFLIAALHHAGIATLTHTPSPMGFLHEILGRGKNEMPFLVLVAGYPAVDCQVPDITRFTLDQYTTFF